MAEQDSSAWTRYRKGVAMLVLGVALQQALLVLPSLIHPPEIDRSGMVSWSAQRGMEWVGVYADLTSYGCAGLTIAGMVVAIREVHGRSRGVFFVTILVAVTLAAASHALAWSEWGRMAMLIRAMIRGFHA